MLYRLSLGAVLLSLLFAWLEFSWIGAFVCTFLTIGTYLVAGGGWRFVRVLYLTLPRDIRLMYHGAKFAKLCKKIEQNNQTVEDIFAQTVKKCSSKIAFVFEDKQWTFQEVDAFTNKVANYFQSIGYKKGDVVALFMENIPELVFFWLGLSKIGVISALINCNLRKESLSHCILIVKSKGLIYSSDPGISGAITDIKSSLKDVGLFEFDANCSGCVNAENLLVELEECSENPPAKHYQKSSHDVLFYVYTSGTTGLPKASVIRQIRIILREIWREKWFLQGSFVIGGLLNISANDVNYSVLPLYHVMAGLVGVGFTLCLGATMVVRRTLSASRFWDECIHHKATVALYVGELCRFLLAQPPRESDRRHTIRSVCGIGLRPQIWDEFKTRFNIQSIVEMYGSTEGVVSLANIFGYPGAIGFFPVLFRSFYPNKVFKMDSGTEELSRGPDGFCIPCQAGEVGQLAGKVIQDDADRRFDGYLDETATRKKIARDVLKKGDQWFVTGDTVVFNELGYVFFHDRLGDTFRWRGENVSTTEVEAVMSKLLGLNSVVVYGVRIPGCEGRAGMAAIEDPEGVVDIEFLGRNLPEVLPSYARPIFLRITNSVDTTGTFKFQKVKLREEGFNISVVADKLYYLEHESGEYRVLTEEVHQKFIDGEMGM